MQTPLAVVYTRQADTHLLFPRHFAASPKYFAMACTLPQLPVYMSIWRYSWLYPAFAKLGSGTMIPESVVLRTANMPYWLLIARSLIRPIPGIPVSDQLPHELR